MDPRWSEAFVLVRVPRRVSEKESKGLLGLGPYILLTTLGLMAESGLTHLIATQAYVGSNPTQAFQSCPNTNELQTRKQTSIQSMELEALVSVGIISTSSHSRVR